MFIKYISLIRLKKKVFDIFIKLCLQKNNLNVKHNKKDSIYKYIYAYIYRNIGRDRKREK